MTVESTGVHGGYRGVYPLGAKIYTPLSKKIHPLPKSRFYAPPQNFIQRLSTLFPQSFVLDSWFFRFLPPEKNLNISGTSGQIGLKFEKNDFQKFVLPPSWLDQSSRVKSISTSDSPADKTGNADIRVPRESGTQAATMSMETSLA